MIMITGMIKVHNTRHSTMQHVLNRPR